MALSGSAALTTEVRRQIDLLAAAAERQGLSLDTLTATFNESCLIAAALAIESPGRSAMVQMTLPHDDGPAHGGARAALSLLSATASARGLLLLQALVQPEDSDLAEVYRSGGFRYLTDLLYMDVSAARERPASRMPADVVLTTYAPELHATFLRALEDSYVDSLDCPGLTGLRTTEDVLAGHRATGVFDPQGWYVALRGDEPIGVLLTAELPQRSALEVVYVGVSHAARGQGVGNYLMAVAFARCRQRRLTAVTLGVDATNAPARALYARWGYRATHRRRVWIAALKEQFHR
ncbi:MAG TPA: GNAT family N-acetyltransferase, partial [Phycisphaerae bacterium]|nr:GNAT family N-acetyltransferase [Phycisphaerae bacterium]